MDDFISKQIRVLRSWNDIIYCTTCESDENEKSDPNIIQNFARNAEKFTVIARFC